jgi:hypothetical protein
MHTILPVVFRKQKNSFKIEYSKGFPLGGLSFLHLEYVPHGIDPFWLLRQPQRSHNGSFGKYPAVESFMRNHNLLCSTVPFHLVIPLYFTFRIAVTGNLSSGTFFGSAFTTKPV